MILGMKRDKSVGGIRVHAEIKEHRTEGSNEKVKSTGPAVPETWLLLFVANIPYFHLGLHFFFLKKKFLLRHNCFHSNLIKKMIGCALRLVEF